jgi:hypothetical protein
MKETTMPRVSLAFFGFAALCGAIGMAWGIYMGISQDHSTFSAHAHLNLLGWVTCALMGAFYALANGRVPRILPWANFGLTITGPIFMIPALAAKIKGATDAGVAIGIAVGAFGSFFGMCCLLASIIIVARKSFAPTIRTPAALTA